MRPTKHTLHRRHFLSTLGATAGITVLAACGEPPVDDSTLHDGKIELLIRKPGTLDPALASRSDEFTILKALFEPLITVDEHGWRVPAAAAQWAESNDGLEIALTLRSNSRWMTGQPVTADAFAWAWNRNLDPEVGGSFNYLMFPISGAQDLAYGRNNHSGTIGVSAIDDSTLRIRLEQRTSGFPARLAEATFFPLPKAEIQSYGSDWTRPHTMRSNGQYRLVQWDDDLGITLLRNDHYWGNPGLFREVVTRFQKNDRNPAIEFRTGAIDVAPVSGTDYREVLSNSDLRNNLKLFARAGTWLLVFNTAKSPWDRAEVRRALAMALDRVAIVGEVFDEPTLPAWSIVPSTILPRVVARKAPNVAGARDLLAQAGFPGGKGLPPLRFTYHSTDTWDRLATHLTRSWRESLGVVVERDERPWRDFLAFTDDPGDFDLYRGGWTSEFRDPSNWYDDLWLSDTDYLRSHWRNALFDSTVRHAGAESNPDLRRRSYLAADELLEASQPAIGIAHHASAYLLHPRISNFGIDPVTGGIDLRAISVNSPR